MEASVFGRGVGAGGWFVGGCCAGVGFKDAAGVRVCGDCIQTYINTYIHTYTQVFSRHAYINVARAHPG